MPGLVGHKFTKLGTFRTNTAIVVLVGVDGADEPISQDKLQRAERYLEQHAGARPTVNLDLHISDETSLPLAASLVPSGRTVRFVAYTIGSLAGIFPGSAKGFPDGVPEAFTTLTSEPGTNRTVATVIGKLSSPLGEQSLSSRVSRLAFTAYMEAFHRVAWAQTSDEAAIAAYAQPGMDLSVPWPNDSISSHQTYNVHQVMQESEGARWGLALSAKEAGLSYEDYTALREERGFLIGYEKWQIKIPLLTASDYAAVPRLA